MEFIQLKDALAIMESTVEGRPMQFDLTVISFDDKRKTGGELMEFKKVSLNDVKFDYKQTVPEQFRREQPVRISLSKNPKHRENKTKNLRLANGQIRKIHIRFITQFNSMQVIY